MSRSEPLAKVSSGVPGAVVHVPPPLPNRPERDFVDPLSGLLDGDPPLDQLSSTSMAPATLPTVLPTGPPAVFPAAPPAALPAALPFAPRQQPAAAFPVAPLQPPAVAAAAMLNSSQKSLSEYVDEFLRSSPVEPPSPESVAPSIGGLRLLARMRAWSKVHQLSRQLLDADVFDEVDELHVYYYFALLKLGRPPFTDLQSELAVFLTEHGPINSMTNKAHVALKLLQVELLQYHDPAAQDPAKAAAQQLCIDELAALQRTCLQFTTDEAQLWWRRVTMSLVNAAVRTGNFRVALIGLDSLRRRPSASPAYDVELLSRIGKVFLQMGDIDSAHDFFARAEVIDGATPSPRVRLNQVHRKSNCVHWLLNPRACRLIFLCRFRVYSPWPGTTSAMRLIFSLE